jgi:hypothetical protein
MVPVKADLFARIAARLRPGGRFVLGDVVVPEDPADVVTPSTACTTSRAPYDQAFVACRRRP